MTRARLARLLSSGLLVGCVAGPPPPDVPGPTDEAIRPDPFVFEWVPEVPGGRVELDVWKQMLTRTARDLDEPLSVSVDDLVPGLKAYWVTGLGRERVCLAGEDRLGGGGAFALVDFGGSARSSPVLFSVPGSRALTCAEILPDERRVALLDGWKHALFLAELDTGASWLLVSAAECPELGRARYLWARPLERPADDAPEGTVLWAMEVPQRDLGTGRLAGGRIELRDSDGDGRFESIR